MTDTIVTTETPRNEAGQFKPAEPAYGREGLERVAGFVPLPDESKAEEPEEFGTAKDAAAERLKQLSGSESAIVTHVTGLPDNVTLTPEQATKELIDSRKEVDAEEQREADKKAAQKEIDELRGEKPADEKQPATETEDDVERALKSPKIRDAIAARVAEAETQRQHHEEAVAHATNFAIASLFGDVPELAHTPVENWAAEIQNLQQRDPARAQAAFARLQAVGQVAAANEQIKAQKAARDQAEMREYTARERARYVDLIKDIPAAKQSEALEQLPKTLAAYGVDKTQFLNAVGNQTGFPRSVAQALMVKAALYDVIMQAPKAIATRDIPPVVRPGVAGPRGAERADHSLAALNAKLSKSGSLKDAVALRLARSKGK